MSLTPAERILLERRLLRRRPSAAPGAVFLGLAALAAAPLAAVALALAGVGVAYAALAEEIDQGLARIRGFDQEALFESTRIYDRDGVLLREVFIEGRRTYIPLREIPRVVLEATIAVEDKTFYTNPGVDPMGILRAVRDNLERRAGAGGGSTITQQIARRIAFSAEEQQARSVTRKAKEIVLALVLTRQASKDQILEWYLNEIYYGNLAYGIEAAAQTIFDKPARDLTLAEAALLVGLPQAPLDRDPLNPDPGVQADVRRRQRDVLDLMVANGFITEAEADDAASEVPHYAEPGDDLFLAPHFVVHVQKELEALVGAERLARGGLEVTTTLDYDLQAIGERVVREQVEKLRDAHNLTNAALISIEPRSGQVLAMVGSADYWNEAIDGNVDVTHRDRQPGSSIKPITYVTALEQGIPTSHMIWDVPMAVWTGGGLYRPKNYDDRFRGPVRLRAALANSYNIPALKLLQTVGIDNMLATAHRLGITGLQQGADHYGLSVTLGGGEVKLVDMATAFGTLANGGQMVRPHAVLEIKDSAGRPVWSLADDEAALTPQEAVSEGAAYIVTDILADNAARTPAFGASSPLAIGVPAAVKTGTTNDFKDNWTVGYTPYLVTGVWAGNSDNSAMRNSSGVTGAAPIWSAFMRAVVGDRARRDAVRAARERFGFEFHTDFRRPAGVVEGSACRLESLNALASACTAYERELFLASALGGPAEGAPSEAVSGDGRVRAPDVWSTVLAVVVPLPPPPPELQVDAEGKPVRFAPAVLCLPGGEFGADKAQPVAVLPLPPAENALGDDERGAAIAWARQAGFAALEPTEACTPEMVAAAMAPGSLPGSAEALAARSGARAEYRLGIAPEAVISSTVTLTGTVTYDPAQVEYYKVELGPGREPVEWFTIGDVHRDQVVDGPIERLDASGLPAGDYIVRLVLVKNDGNFLNPPYSVPIRIAR